jgi:sortase A
MSEEKNRKPKAGYLKYIGILLLLLGLGILYYTFQPFISSYLDYKFTPQSEKDIKVELTKGEKDITTDIKKDTEVVFVDNEFGLYIPKIQANAKVIKNVDPYDYDTYRSALAKGVVHAKGSSLPSEPGNVFLFAHSTVNFYERRQYNVYFYLLGELEKDDPIYVSYQGQIYKYKVLEFKVVKPEEIQYMGQYMEQDTLTLMTCWPVGSNTKRAIITAIRDTE